MKHKVEMTFFYSRIFAGGYFLEFAGVTAEKINLPSFSTQAIKVQILLGQKLVCFSLF